jgi:hypothetical protein
LNKEKNEYLKPNAPFDFPQWTSRYNLQVRFGSNLC